MTASTPMQPARPGGVSRSGRVSTSGPAPVEVGDREAQARTEPDMQARPGEGRRWVLEFPAHQELLASNQSQHPMRVHRIGTPIKNDAIKLCRFLKIPHLERAAFVLEYQPPTRGRAVVKDTHNLSGTAKAAIDGCVAAGVLTDDSDRYVADVSYRRGDKHPGGRIVLIIQEVLS